MHSQELTIGRTFGVTFDRGEEFFESLRRVCRERGVQQGYIPMFVAAFSEVDIVGTCEALADPRAPVWSRVHLENVEAFGCATIAYDEEHDEILPHVHVAVGLKAHSATGHASHLLGARVQFLVEMLLVEVLAPSMRRRVDATMYDVPLLTFGPTG